MDPRGLPCFAQRGLPARGPAFSVRVTAWPTGSAAATIRTSTYTNDLKRQLSLERAVVVSPDDMQALRDALTQTGFWKLTTPWYTEGSNGIVAIPVCADGTFVASEAISGGGYHIVVRMCGR